jgi:hypothetical protein
MTFIPGRHSEGFLPRHERSFQFLVVDHHDDPLRAGYGVLPRQADVLSVFFSELFDLAHYALPCRSRY